ncbi:uncharacterized protein E0L32_007393 [Thyridium curvatum]|uniref:Uncharacterized protein n=1 Tax=Thyridium curvatum TaxID=1093900 RepID=A0A507AMH6_9PEZI|nr:uncharacterized protein E0L32_007393 [Thyridium curvatum]TPX11895.1 hypothetical protein E0L32_007393 [Thyridium curvatum]
MPPKVNNIASRNVKSAKEMETLLMRALCDSMDDAKEYIAPDCAMINPFISSEVLGRKPEEAQDRKQQPVLEALDRVKPLRGYQMDRDTVRVVEVDMMAVSILYKGSFTTDDGRQHPVSVHSTWRQNAGADWLLCSQLVAPE